MFNIKELIVTVGIVAFNESENIPYLLNDLLNQTYPKSKTELLFIDSMSTDNTVNILKDFLNKNINDYYKISILQNFGKIQASGWNVAIDNFTGDALIRVDAHSHLTENFIENNVACLNNGEMVCGGKRPNIIKEHNGIKPLVLLADTSIFGGSFASYHKSDKKHYVNTLFHACYRKEVIKKVGHFNEKLGRTEDNDFNYRVCQNGYKICYDPSIVSYQYSRGSLISSIKQKFGNGYWVARTMGIAPNCISLFHFAPFCFVAAIILSLIFCIFSYIPLFAILGLYFLTNIVVSTASVITFKPFKAVNLLLPIILFILHLSYGIGSFFGFASLLSKNKG